MLIEKTIQLPIFSYKIKVVLSDTKDEIKNKYPEMDETCSACTLEYRDCNFCRVLLVLDDYFISNMAHELVHAKNCLYRYINQYCDRDNDEIEAYILGYLVSEITKIQNKYEEESRKI